MAPPAEDWEEDEEDGDEADGPDVIGDDYDVDQGGDDDDSESFFSDEGSSSSDSVRGHCWPDPFDVGTEASTPARSSRSPSIDDSSRLPSARFAPDECPGAEDEASDSEAALHDDYAVVLSAAAEIARCADARFGLVRQQTERRCVLRIQPLPQPLLEVLHARFPMAASSPLSTRRMESSCHGDFRSMPPTAWHSLHSDFREARLHPEVVPLHADSGSALASDFGSGRRADGDLRVFPVVPAPTPAPVLQADACEQPRAGDGSSFPEAAAGMAPNAEAVLRAQMDAKQVLMSVVLKVIFTMQLTEQAPEAAVASPLEPSLLQASRNCGLESRSEEATEVPQAVEEMSEASAKQSCRSSSKECIRKSSIASSRGGRRLILAPRYPLRTPTRPRQPPPRPEKRPPVPRAPRTSTPSSKESASKVGEDQPAIALRGECRASASSPTSSVEESDEVEPVCYEVSDDEFSRLVHAGALEGFCDHDAETFDAQMEQAYEVSDEEFERLLQAGVLSMAVQEDGALDLTQLGSADASTEKTKEFRHAGDCSTRMAKEPARVAAPSGALPQRPPPPAVAHDAPQIRRRSEPTSTAHARGDQSSKALGRQPRMPPKSAPAKPLVPKPAPKRLGKAICESSRGSACRGGLFFLPTDGVPAVGSRATPRSLHSASASSREEVDALGEAVSTEADEMGFHEFIDSYRTAVAGSSLHSARLLREQAAPRSMPSRWEEPPPPPMQRRAPTAPAIARFKSPGNLPRIDFRNITAAASSGASFSEFGFEGFSSGATSSAHCDFRDDCHGFVPFEEDMIESKGLLTRSPGPGRELAWDSGALPCYGPHGRRVPRKLAPLP